MRGFILDKTGLIILNTALCDGLGGTGNYIDSVDYTCQKKGESDTYKEKAYRFGTSLNSKVISNYLGKGVLDDTLGGQATMVEANLTLRHYKLYKLDAKNNVRLMATIGSDGFNDDSLYFFGGDGLEDRVIETYWHLGYRGNELARKVNIFQGFPVDNYKYYLHTTIFDQKKESN